MAKNIHFLLLFKKNFNNFCFILPHPPDKFIFLVIVLMSDDATYFKSLFPTYEGMIAIYLTRYTFFAIPTVKLHVKLLYGINHNDFDKSQLFPIKKIVFSLNL